MVIFLVGTLHLEAAKLVHSPAVNLSLGTASRDRFADVVMELNILVVLKQDNSGLCWHL